MPEIEIVADSHIEPTQTNEEILSETYEAFGIAPREPKTDEAAHDEEGRSVNDPPAKEEVKTEVKIHKFKHNKEEVEVDISTDEKLTDHLQRSLALDKERERKTELEKTLDRAAKLAGFKDHTEYAANLDRLEQQQQQIQQTALDKMKNDLLDELVEAGNLDRAKAEQYIENHPLFQEGRKAIEEKQTLSKQQEEAARWQPLYKAYPDLEKAVIDAKGQAVEWYTPELGALIARGNDPLLAYEHLNKDKIKAETTKSAEQKAIKDLQLGNRSAVETVPMGGQEEQASEELRNAFSMFGMDPRRANKYVKK